MRRWGRARRYDLNDWLSTKLQLQMSPEAGMSQSMFDINVKRDHYNAELKVGSNQFYGEHGRISVCLTWQ